MSGGAFGARVVVLGDIASTMDATAGLDAATPGGLPDGTVILADHQAAGRGRLGRAWLSEPGQSLLLSVCLRPVGLGAERLGGLPMALALGALAALRLRLPGHGARAALKWPNDVCVGGRKIGGLLAEVAWEPGGARVILGLGLNVRQRSLPGLPDATSLALCLSSGSGAKPAEEDGRLDRGALAIDLLRAAGGHYRALMAGADLTGAWAAELETLGRRVTALPTQDGQPIRGLARGVSPDGALEIRTDDGRSVLVHAGDVTLAAGGPRAD